MCFRKLLNSDICHVNGLCKLFTREGQPSPDLSRIQNRRSGFTGNGGKRKSQSLLLHALADFSRERYQSIVRRSPSSKFTCGLYPRCFSDRDRSASECFTSPARSGPCFTSPGYPVSFLSTLNISFRSMRVPVATLNTFPATSLAGALQASKFACTTLST